MNMAQLSTVFKTVKNDYAENVDAKKCASKETSALYNKCVVELADGKILNLETLMGEFQSSLSGPDNECPTEYSHAKANLEILMGRVKNDLTYFKENYFGEVIKKAVDDAFTEIDTEYKGLDTEYHESVTTIDGLFGKYNNLSDRKNQYERRISNASGDPENTSIDSWRSQVSSIKIEMRNVNHQIETNVNALKKIVEKMKDILVNDGYEKI